MARGSDLEKFYKGLDNRFKKTKKSREDASNMSIGCILLIITCLFPYFGIPMLIFYFMINGGNKKKKRSKKIK